MARAEIIDDVQNAAQAAEADNLLPENPLDFSQELEEPEEQLPEKYQGKSLRDLAEMHQNAEKIIGKHSQEVGELRRIVDDFIRNQTSTPQASNTEHEEDLDDVDFFTDPQKAISKAIERHPAVQQANKYTKEYKMSTASAELQRKHPDLKDIISDTSFQEWVKGSKIRTQLFMQADQNYDFDSADELLTTWKEIKGMANQAVQAEQKARKSTAKQAATGSARASSESMPRKKYRRADIIKLMQTDPKRYEALQPEIMQAYAEGRVV